MRIGAVGVGILVCGLVSSVVCWAESDSREERESLKGLNGVEVVVRDVREPELGQRVLASDLATQIELRLREAG